MKNVETSLKNSNSKMSKHLSIAPMISFILLVVTLFSCSRDCSDYSGSYVIISYQKDRFFDEKGWYSVKIDPMYNHYNHYLPNDSITNEFSSSLFTDPFGGWRRYEVISIENAYPEELVSELTTENLLKMTLCDVIFENCKKTYPDFKIIEDQYLSIPSDGCAYFTHVYISNLIDPVTKANNVTRGYLIFKSGNFIVMLTVQLNPKAAELYEKQNTAKDVLLKELLEMHKDFRIEKK